LAWCQALGAERVVNYKTGDVDRAVAEFAPAGVDVSWDTSGKPDFDQAVARLARPARNRQNSLYFQAFPSWDDAKTLSCHRAMRGAGASSAEQNAGWWALGRRLRLHSQSVRQSGVPNQPVEIAASRR
jgi:NADPH:quinone reductase-like Zn-dependent oxidoreductase